MRRKKLRAIRPHDLRIMRHVVYRCATSTHRSSVLVSGQFGSIFSSASDSDEMSYKPTEAGMKDTSNSNNDFDSLLASPNSSPVKPKPEAAKPKPEAAKPKPKPKPAPAKKKKESWESSDGEDNNVIDQDTDDEDFSLVRSFRTLAELMAFHFLVPRLFRGAKV